MKKYLLKKVKIKAALFASVFLLCNFVYGQPVTKESYEKAVDYLNCKAIELSLKTNIAERDSDTRSPSRNMEIYKRYQNEFRCNEGVTYERIFNFLTKTDFYQTGILSKEIESLKSSYRQDSKSEIVTFLSEDVFKDGGYMEMVRFAFKRRNSSDLAAFKEDLRNTLPTIIQAENSPNTKTNSNKNNIAVPNEEITPQSIPSKEDRFNIMYIILPIAFLILLAGLIISILYLKNEIKSSNQETQRKLYDYIDRKLKSMQSNLSADPITPSLSGLDKLKAEIEELKKVAASKTVLKHKIIELKKEVDSLRNALSEDGTYSGAIYSETPKTYPQKEIKTANPFDSRREVFYFSTPDEDGTFKVKNVHSSYKKDASIYKFTKTSPTEAEFQINDSESSFKLALEYPDKNIDPVCHTLKVFNPKATRVITDKAGIAVLVGDKWRVTSKALIRYEY